MYTLNHILPVMTVLELKLAELISNSCAKLHFGLPKMLNEKLKQSEGLVNNWIPELLLLGSHLSYVCDCCIRPSA